MWNHQLELNDLFGHQKSISITPWKTNMSPKNHWLEDVFPIEIAPF